MKKSQDWALVLVILDLHKKDTIVILWLLLGMSNTSCDGLPLEETALLRMQLVCHMNEDPSAALGMLFAISFIARLMLN